MSSDNKPVQWRSIATSPVFWRAVIIVVAGTSTSAILWLFRSYQILAIIGMAVTQIGAFVMGLYLLLRRQNRSLALGLLTGLVVVYLVAILFFIAFLLSLRGARNF